MVGGLVGDVVALGQMQLVSLEQDGLRQAPLVQARLPEQSVSSVQVSLHEAGGVGLGDGLAVGAGDGVAVAPGSAQVWSVGLLGFLQVPVSSKQK